jgi:hypothetical protein
MRTRVRHVLNIAAAIAIAMHSVLWGGMTTVATSAIVDPLSVICHGAADETADQTPSHPLSRPSHACDHCNLCGGVAPAANSAATAITQLLPARLSHHIKPASTVGASRFEVSLKGARGPPVSV